MLHAIVEQLRDPLGVALPFFFVFIGIEAVAFRFLDDDERPKKDAKGYSYLDARTSVSMGLGALGLGIFFRAASLLLYTALWEYVAPWHLDAHRWQTWIGLLLLVDFLWYWYHRASHRIRLMWAAHQAHHSSEYFNLSTALRQKWNQWFESLIWLPLPLIGMPPWLIYIAFSLNLIYQFFSHTERIEKLPRPVELILNTPSHHRVHHGSDPIYLDRNYGGILIIWDRLFGTFQPELHRPTYGLTKQMNTYNIVTLQFHEYAAILRDLRTATTWRARLGYVFGPPGWSPVRPVDARLAASPEPVR